MVQSKSDREKQKLITDKCQSLIEVLLKDEDNKYCVDCDAKGPRWASWNLGVFLCIRCAGIHRNLGVHISRVKSVNLDSWTPEHVAYVQRMGNSRARAIYEANLPDDFTRPQTDTALESFIRAKYEHKKYIAQDYVDPGPPEPAFNVEEELKRIKEQKRSKLSSIGGSNKPMLSISSDLTASNLSKSRPSQQQQQQQPKQELQSEKDFLASSVVSDGNQVSKSSKSALADLIDLDLGFGNTSSNNNISNNLSFNDSMKNSASSNLASLADLVSPTPMPNLSMSMQTSTAASAMFNMAPSMTSPFASMAMPMNTSAINFSSPSISSSSSAPKTNLNASLLQPTSVASETKPADTVGTSKNVLDLLDL